MATYRSQSARDAQRSGYGGESYAEYLESKALEYAERFPTAAEYFLTRSLGEALAGNDGM